METMYIAFCILFLVYTVVTEPPPNDDACDATLIHIGDSVVADLTNEATKETGEISPGNGTYEGYGQDGWYYNDIDVQNSIWYKVIAFELQLEMVKYAGNCLDSQLAVYTVSDCADFSTFTLIKANDDSGCVFAAHIFPFTECVTQEYYIQVDSLGGATGSFQMEVAGMEEGECPAMTNDNVCDATQIAVGDVVIDVLTQSGTKQTNEIIPPNITDCTGQSGWCGSWEGPWEPNVQNSLWYKVTASELELEMVCYAGVCIDTQLAVYTATDCGDFSTFTLVKANDDKSNDTVASHILPFNNSNNITQCVEYYIQVDGFAVPGSPEGIATGVFQMNVIGECECNSCTAAPSSAPTTSSKSSASSASSASSESSDSKTSDSISEDSDDRKKKKKKKQKSSSDSSAYALFENEEFDDTEMNMASKTKRVVLQFSDFTVMNVWLLLCVIVVFNVILVCLWYATKK